MERQRLKSCKAAHEIVDRLLDWHDQAKLAGRECRANELLGLAWYAYDLPAKWTIIADRETKPELPVSLLPTFDDASNEGTGSLTATHLSQRAKELHVTMIHDKEMVFECAAGMVELHESTTRHVVLPRCVGEVPYQASPSDRAR
jgi:hypothetical protein